VVELHALTLTPDGSVIVVSPCNSNLKDKAACPRPKGIRGSGGRTPFTLILRTGCRKEPSDRVRPTAGLQTLEKTICCPCPESNHDFLVVRPILKSGDIWYSVSIMFPGVSKHFVNMLTAVVPHKAPCFAHVTCNEFNWKRPGPSGKQCVCNRKVPRSTVG
jgi:hypothetical protein